MSNPGLSPLCHFCAKWSGAVVARKRPQRGCRRRFWRPGSPSHQPPASLPTLFLLWMPSQCLCWQSGNNPSGNKRVSMTRIPMRRAWQCPRMKPWSMLEERRALGDTRHPASWSPCFGTKKKKINQEELGVWSGRQSSDPAKQQQPGTATQRVAWEHASVGAHWLQAQHLAKS